MVLTLRPTILRNRTGKGIAALISAFIVFLFIATTWNDKIAGWVEDSVWYFPHVTKVYISLALSGSIIYRGIYFPLKNGITLTELLPFWWIKVGLLGLMLDVAKAPGYVLGALLKLFSK